jgi:hypothetical protein
LDLSRQAIEVNMFYKSIKSTLCAIIPRGGRLMVFVLNPFKPVTLFIKCIHALYLSGQLKLFHVYPVNVVSSKKSNQTKWSGTILNI